ncbi:AraC family transcriptional regulator [Micromonospora psammae]|uniref:AraC family transcriptional regulator n=1 Tax=Micromonospora sp. CPCC 205556 TaxID=3122398 RepID=UPI002FF435D8
MPVSRHTHLAAVHDLPRSGTIDWHQHEQPQLVYAASGILTVTTAVGAWVVPAPTRAVWIPAGVTHAHRADRAAQLHTLLLPHHDGAPTDPTMLWVSPLMREVIQRLTTTTPTGRRRDRLVAVLLDELHDEGVAPLLIPPPRDGRLQRLLAELTENPAQVRSLDDVAVELGTSARTLSRLCREQLGLTYPQLRNRVRLLHALVLLADGATVTSVSYACGWDKPSSFIDAFRTSLGATPGAFRRAQPGGRSFPGDRRRHRPTGRTAPGPLP